MNSVQKLCTFHRQIQWDFLYLLFKNICYLPNWSPPVNHVLQITFHCDFILQTKFFFRRKYNVTIGQKLSLEKLFLCMWLITMQGKNSTEIALNLVVLAKIMRLSSLLQGNQQVCNSQFIYILYIPITSHRKFPALKIPKHFLLLTGHRGDTRQAAIYCIKETFFHAWCEHFILKFAVYPHVAS